MDGVEPSSPVYQTGILTVETHAIILHPYGLWQNLTAASSVTGMRVIHYTNNPKRPLWSDRDMGIPKVIHCRTPSLRDIFPSINEQFLQIVRTVIGEVIPACATQKMGRLGPQLFSGREDSAGHSRVSQSLFSRNKSRPDVSMSTPLGDPR